MGKNKQNRSKTQIREGEQRQKCHTRKTQIIKPGDGGGKKIGRSLQKMDGT